MGWAAAYSVILSADCKGVVCMNKPSFYGHSSVRLASILCGRADAAAVVRGSADYPGVFGTVLFYQTAEGVIVFVEVCGLPDMPGNCHEGIFGFHIHAGTDCGGNAEDFFADAGGHLNLQNCAHPYHTGDMPPLFGNSGLAISVFLSSRFVVDEVIGRTVIIHDHPDDFTTQPSGNSGTKIACGVIERLGGKEK